MPNEHRQNYVLFATCRFPDDHQVAVLGRHGPTPGRRAAPRVDLGVTHPGGPKQAVYSPPTSPPYPRKWAKSGQNGPKHRDPLSRAPNWGQAPKNASNGRPQVHQGHLQRTRSYVYLKMRLLSHTPLSQSTASTQTPTPPDGGAAGRQRVVQGPPGRYPVHQHTRPGNAGPRQPPRGKPAAGGPLIVEFGGKVGLGRVVRHHPGRPARTQCPSAHRAIIRLRQNTHVHDFRRRIPRPGPRSRVDGHQQAPASPRP